jgi:hypothetical protein
VSLRVAFIPAEYGQTVPLHPLGEDVEGRWGLLDDAAWMAPETVSGIELLSLSHAEFLHAVRGLGREEVGQVVAHRRRLFSSVLPAQALGEVAALLARCVSLLPAWSGAAALTMDLLTALASFTIVPRLASTPSQTLIDYLREGDSEILAELASPSMRAAGVLDARDEPEVRRRFALELGQIAAKHGQAGKDRVLPHVDVVRTYFITPIDRKAEQQARFLGNPARPWRDGILLPLPERMARQVKLRGHATEVIFPALGPFVGALQECTPAQLEVELGERLTRPELPAYLDERRVQQAALRVAVQLLAGADSELGPLLHAQVQRETASLQGWLSRDAGATVAISDVPAELRALVDAATLLAFLCRRQGSPGPAGKVEAIGRALSHVAEEMRS